MSDSLTPEERKRDRIAVAGKTLPASLERLRRALKDPSLERMRRALKDPSLERMRRALKDPNLSKEARYYEALEELLGPDCPRSEWRLFECLLDGQLRLSPWPYGKLLQYGALRLWYGKLSPLLESDVIQVIYPEDGLSEQQQQDRRREQLHKVRQALNARLILRRIPFSVERLGRGRISWLFLWPTTDPDALEDARKAADPKLERLGQQLDALGPRDEDEAEGPPSLEGREAREEAAFDRVLARARQTPADLERQKAAFYRLIREGREAREETALLARHAKEEEAALLARHAEEESTRPRLPTDLPAAKAFLQERLPKGTSEDGKVLKQAWLDRGGKPNTLRRAFRDLHVRAFQKDFGSGKRSWELPTNP